MLIKRKYFGVGLQVVVEDAGWDGQVSGAEGVSVIPALRAKFTPLGDASVEEAEWEEHGVKLLFSGALVQRLLEQKQKDEKIKKTHTKKI